MLTNRFIVRNLEGETLRENFLVSAVISLIVIRGFLALTDYPQIAGGTFHIAHMIWGGLLMMIAIIVLLSFLNKSATNTAAIIGGVGFGMFIDELGKFITRDNNYFFEPTIAIIYIIFILLYLVARLIPKYKSISKREYLVNALELTKEAIVNDLDINEKKKAIIYLRRSSPRDPVARALRHLLKEIDAIPVSQTSPIIRTRKFARDLYIRLARSRLILNVVVVILILQSLATIFSTTQLFIDRPVLMFYEWGKIASALLSVIFIILGLVAFARSRLTAFNYFKLAVLVSIFLTQFFVFYEAQLGALLNLVINVALLLVINYAIYEEQEENNRELKATLLEDVE